MKNVFDENPRLEKCYVTSDGNAFYNETDAKAYAKTLEDKEVEVVLNSKLIEVTDVEDLTDEAKEMQEFETSESELANQKETQATAEPVTPKAKK